MLFLPYPFLTVQKASKGGIHLRKYLTSCLVLLFCVSILAGCGETPPDEPSKQAEETVLSTEKSIGDTVPVEESQCVVTIPSYTLTEFSSQEQIQGIDSFAVMVGGEALFYSDEQETVAEIADMFSSAEWLGYEPQTYSMGLDLLLFSGGQGIRIELDLMEDLCRMGELFYDYGPGMNGSDSINGMIDLWELLGWDTWTIPNITKWPKQVISEYDYYFVDLMPAEMNPRKHNTVFRYTSFSVERDNLELILKNGDVLEIKSEEMAEPILKELFWAELLEVKDNNVDAQECAYTLRIQYWWGLEGTWQYVGNDTYLITVLYNDDIEAMYTSQCPILDDLINKTNLL